eukprot:1157315-Pelagomonas_calceolata.AAC.5
MGWQWSLRGCNAYEGGGHPKMGTHAALAGHSSSTCGALMQSLRGTQAALLLTINLSSHGRHP